MWDIGSLVHMHTTFTRYQSLAYIFLYAFIFWSLAYREYFFSTKKIPLIKNPQISSFKRLGLIATILLWFKPLLIFKSNNFQGKKKFTASLQLFLLAKLSLSVLSIILCYFDFGKANLETELNGYFGMRVFKFLMMLAINQIRTKKFWNNQKCYKTVAEMKRAFRVLINWTGYMNKFVERKHFKVIRYVFWLFPWHGKVSQIFQIFDSG